MQFTHPETDRVRVAPADEAARNRQEHGVTPNCPEAIVRTTCFAVGGRDVGRAVAAPMQAGACLLTIAHGMQRMPEMIHDVQVGTIVAKGTRQVSVHEAIR